MYAREWRVEWASLIQAAGRWVGGGGFCVAWRGVAPGSWRRRVAVAVAVVAAAAAAGGNGYGACITLAALASALKGHSCVRSSHCDLLLAALCAQREHGVMWCVTCDVVRRVWPLTP